MKYIFVGEYDNIEVFDTKEKALAEAEGSESPEDCVVYECPKKWTFKSVGVVASEVKI